MVQDKFVKYLQFEKRASPHTVSSYQVDLNQFFEFLSRTYETSDIKSVSHQMIRSWIVELMDRASTRTVNRKITTLKSFYRYLLREQLVEHNPMQKIVSPKNAKRLPDFVEERAMEKLANDELYTSDFSGIRDRLILEMLYGTGIRLSELIGLKEIDANLTQGEIKVLGKRNKERMIPLHNPLLELLKNYLEQRKSEFVGNTTAENLFLTNKGKALYPKFVYRLVYHYLGLVTTNRKRSPHVLRHTFATHLLNREGDLNAIKELLGHANLSATQIYTHNTFSKLKSVYSKAHPRAK